MNDSESNSLQKNYGLHNFFAFSVKTIVCAITSELFLLPFWLYKNSLNLFSISSFQIFITSIILPIWFCVCGIIFVWKNRRESWIPAIFILITALVISQLISYFNWAISVGSILHPDAETILLIEATAAIACGICIIPVVFAMIIRLVVDLKR